MADRRHQAGAGSGRERSRSRSGSSHARNGSTSIRQTTAPGAIQPSIAVRLIAVGLVLGVLLLSAAVSTQVYFRQRGEIASLQQDIAQREAAIEELQFEVDRWDDPAYVEQQARERFGWVKPGEVGYRVIGEDGRPVDGAVLNTAPEDDQPALADAWWLEMWGSTKAADRHGPGGGDGVLGE